MITPLTALGGVVTPALQAIASASTPDDAQGELQGVFASLNAIAMITSPLVMTSTFSHFTATDAPVFAPGAPFLLAAVLMLACSRCIVHAARNADSAIRVAIRLDRTRACTLASLWTNIPRGGGGRSPRPPAAEGHAMKLKDLEIFVVAPPAPGWGGRYWIFTKLTTDDGIVGYGECYASTVGPKAMNAVIEDVFDRHMQGENPENIELMFRRAYSSGFTQRPDPTVMGAFSGLEIACWDILGKARNRRSGRCWAAG